MTDNLSSMIGELEKEEVLTFDDFAEETGGAWPRGWYSAVVIEGYSTAKGKVFATEDSTSQKGDSRNLRLCFRVTGPGGERTMQESFNYRATDFTPERQAFIKEARLEYKGVKGRWSDADAQRTSLALAKLGAITKSLGLGFPRGADGGLNPTPMIGQRIDVRLGINEENGFNEITGFAKAGTKSAKA